MNGMMVDTMKESGKKAKCMDVELMFGLMGGNTKENTKKIGKKAKGLLSGQMENDMKVAGKMGNNMGLANLLSTINLRK